MCVLQVQAALVSLSAGSHEANTVQKAVLLWTFQSSALARRGEGLGVEEQGENTEDCFVPTIHKQFQRSSVTAPLLW